ncbi:MAG TPA: hypothetical protein VLI54_03150 [Bacillota bacterium]|nr:hypothetical protein [Bacillota bacterium]
MKHFEKLEGYVADGSMRVVQAVGVPRSMSTALGRALHHAKGPTVYVNEPFNRHNACPDVAAELLLRHALPLCESQGAPVTVITKSMASYMPFETFRAMEGLSAATIWTVRDPLVQMGSLMTRLANDRQGGHGTKKITQEELGPHLDGVAAYLQDSERSTDFSKTGWQSIGDHYRVRDGRATSVVVDGQEFVAQPHALLSQVCGQVGIKFCEQMVEGWGLDYTNACNGDDKEKTAWSAWTSDAATSTGVVPVERAPLDLAVLPDSIRRHIAEVALPTYEMMTCPSAL